MRPCNASSFIYLNRDWSKLIELSGTTSGNVFGCFCQASICVMTSGNPGQLKHGRLPVYRAVRARYHFRAEQVQASPVACHCSQLLICTSAGIQTTWALGLELTCPFRGSCHQLCTQMSLCAHGINLMHVVPVLVFSQFYAALHSKTSCICKRCTHG